MRGSTNAGAARAYAVELLALTPDIIVASGTQGAIALKQLTRAVPIVFTRLAPPQITSARCSRSKTSTQSYAVFT
jgi:hypothetical protein